LEDIDLVSGGVEIKLAKVEPKIFSFGEKV